MTEEEATVQEQGDVSSTDAAASAAYEQTKRMLTLRQMQGVLDDLNAGVLNEKDPRVQMGLVAGAEILSGLPGGTLFDADGIRAATGGACSTPSELSQSVLKILKDAQENDFFYNSRIASAEKDEDWAEVSRLCNEASFGDDKTRYLQQWTPEQVAHLKTRNRNVERSLGFMSYAMGKGMDDPGVLTGFKTAIVMSRGGDLDAMVEQGVFDNLTSEQLADALYVADAMRSGSEMGVLDVLGQIPKGFADELGNFVRGAAWKLTPDDEAKAMRLADLSRKHGGDLEKLYADAKDYEATISELVPMSDIGRYWNNKARWASDMERWVKAGDLARKRIEAKSILSQLDDAKFLGRGGVGEYLYEAMYMLGSGAAQLAETVVAASAGSVVGGPLGGLAATAAVFGASEVGRSRDEFIAAGMSAKDADALATAIGAATGVIEVTGDFFQFGSLFRRLGVNLAAGGTPAQRAVREAAKRAAQKKPGLVGKARIEEEVAQLAGAKASVVRRIGRVAKDAAKVTATEFVEEGVSQAAASAMKLSGDWWSVEGERMFTARGELESFIEAMEQTAKYGFWQILPGFAANRALRGGGDAPAALRAEGISQARDGTARLRMRGVTLHDATAAEIAAQAARETRSSARMSGVPLKVIKDWKEGMTQEERERVIAEQKLTEEQVATLDATAHARALAEAAGDRTLTLEEEVVEINRQIEKLGEADEDEAVQMLDAELLAEEEAKRAEESEKREGAPRAAEETPKDGGGGAASGELEDLRVRAAELDERLRAKGLRKAERAKISEELSGVQARLHELSGGNLVLFSRGEAGAARPALSPTKAALRDRLLLKIARTAGIRVIREGTEQITASARNAELRMRLGGYMGSAWSARANDALERGLRELTPESSPRSSLGAGGKVLRGEPPFPLAPKSGEGAGEKLGEFMPVPFAGNKKTIIEAHAELFRRIGELARSAGGRVIDAFAGAGTYTAGLGALGALPQGSVLNEWAASRYVMHKMLAKNPEGVADAVRELLARFAQSAELAEFRRKLEAVRRGAEEKTKLTQALVDWFNDELRGKHGVKYIEGTENSAFGDANLIESEASAAFYVVLQTLTTGSHPVNFKFDEKGKLFIEVANGVFRTGHLSTRLINAKGGFNENALNPEKYTKRIEATGRAYRAARLDVRRGDGWALAKTAKRGDVVFVDPAYLGVQAYGKSGVTATDANDKELAIARLADLVKWADAHGASIVYTNEYSDKSGTGGMSQAEYAEVWEEALKRIGTETASVNYFDRQARGMGKGGEARADIVFATGAASHLLKTSRVELDAIKARHGAETDEEAEAIAWEAKTRGLSAEQLAQAEEWRRVRYSLGAAEQAAWDGALDDYEAGRLEASRSVTVLPRTPAVLQRCGAANLPLRISVGTLNKVVRGKHSVPVRELRGLLVNLDNPIAVFRSRTQADSLVVLTELRDEANGNNAVVAVRLDAKESGGHEINAIASVYGKSPYSIDGMLRDGLALYAHTQKIRAYYRTSQGLQLPPEATKRGSSPLLTQDDFTQDELGVVKVNNKILRNGAGIVYGYWDEGRGELHLNEDFADFDTPLHEWAHVWLSWVRKADARVAERALALTKETKFYKELRADEEGAYAGLSDDALAEEAFAMLCGKDGGEIMAQEGVSTWTKLRRAVLNVFKAALRTLGVSESVLSRLTFRDMQSLCLRDLLDEETFSLKELRASVSAKRALEDAASEAVIDNGIEDAARKRAIRSASVAAAGKLLMRRERMSREQVESAETLALLEEAVGRMLPTEPADVVKAAAKAARTAAKVVYSSRTKADAAIVDSLEAVREASRAGRILRTQRVLKAADRAVRIDADLYADAREYVENYTKMTEAGRRSHVRGLNPTLLKRLYGAEAFSRDFLERGENAKDMTGAIADIVRGRLPADASPYDVLNATRETLRKAYAHQARTWVPSASRERALKFAEAIDVEDTLDGVLAAGRKAEAFLREHGVRQAAEATMKRMTKFLSGVVSDASDATKTTEKRRYSGEFQVFAEALLRHLKVYEKARKAVEKARSAKKDKGGAEEAAAAALDAAASGAEAEVRKVIAELDALENGGDAHGAAAFDAMSAKLSALRLLSDFDPTDAEGVAEIYAEVRERAERDAREKNASRERFARGVEDDARVLTKALDSREGVEQYDQQFEGKRYVSWLFKYAYGLKQRTDSLIRFATGSTRAEAERVSERNHLREVRANTEKEKNKLRRIRAFREMLSETMGLETEAQVRAFSRKMSKKREELAKFSRSGKVAMSYDQALNLYLGLRQEHVSGRLLDMDEGVREKLLERNREANILWGQIRKTEELGAVLERAGVLRYGDGLVRLLEAERKRLDDAATAYFGTALRVYPGADLYFPIVRMRRESTPLTPNATGQANVVPSSALPRVANYRPLDDEQTATGAFLGQIEETEHFAAYGGLSRYYTLLFLNKEFSRALWDKAGSRVFNQFRKAASDTVNGQFYSADDIGASALMNAAVNVTTVLALGFNVGTAIKQLGSFLAFANEIGWTRTFKALVFSDDAEGRAERIREMTSHPLWAARFQGAGSFHEAKNLATYGSTTLVGGWWKRYAEVSMTTVRLGDALAVLTVGQGLYGATKAKLMRSVNVRTGALYTEAEARDEAMSFVMDLADRTQQAGRTANFSAYQRGAKATYRIIGQFMSSTSQMWAMEARALEDVAARGITDKASRDRLLTVMMNNHFVNPVVVWGATLLVQLLFKGELPDEDNATDLIWAMLLGPLGGIFLVGGAITGMFKDTGFADTAFPVLSMAARTGKNAVGLAKSLADEEEGTTQRAAYRFLRDASAPTRQAAQLIDAWVKDLDGRESGNEAF